MSKTDLFEFYEILALILPGAVFLYGISKMFPNILLFSFSNNFSAGEFGVFILIAYAFGHIIQVFGGFVEILWRAIRGEPTEWIREGKKQLFSDYQIRLLEKRIPDALGIPRDDFKLQDLNRKQWLHMHKHMYTLVMAGDNGKRLEKFHAIYTMCRGLVAALALLALLSLFILPSTQWYISSGLLVFAGILFYRMVRFEKHAIHELFIQFLQLKPAKKEATLKKETEQNLD